MKKIYCLVVMLLFTSSFAGWPTDFDTVEVKNNNNQIFKRWVEARNTGNESQFKKYGTLKYWHTDGQLSETGFYYWDNKESVFSTWYENGNRKSCTNYLNNKKHGRQTEWFHKDYLKTDIYYKEDMLNGLCIWRDYQEDIHNPQLGFIKKAFYVNGKELVVIISNSDYKDFRPPYFNEEFQLLIEWTDMSFFKVGKLKNNKKHGKWITYNVAGEILDIDLYQHGEIIVVED